MNLRINLFWSLFGLYCLFILVAVCIMYDWPPAFMIGLGVGSGLGIGMLRGKPSPYRRASLILSPLGGVMLIGFLRLLGNSDLLFFVGGSACMAMLMVSAHQAFFSEYHPSPTDDHRSPSTHRGHERLRREEAQWRDEQRRKREQGR